MGESMNGHSESRSLETLDFLLFMVLGFVLAIDVTWDHFNLAEVLYPPLGSYSGSALVVLSMAVLFAFSVKFIISPTIHYLRWKNSCLYLIILLLVIVPTLTKVWVRSLGVIHPLEIAHDGGIVHTEAAAQMLLRGQNPYASSFGDTALADTPTKSMLDHYPYAPLSFLIPAALILPVEAMGIFYDQRYVYIVLYILTLVALSRIINDRLLASMVVTFVGLNTLLATNLRFGMNDIYFLAFLTFATLWFVRARWYLAFVALALACTLKGIAWLIAPFFIVWTLKVIPRPQFVRGLMLLLLVWSGIQIPFVIWSPTDYIKDVLSPEQVFALGGTPGFGFTVLPVVLGQVKDINAVFPSAVLQLMAGLPLFLYGVWRLLIRLLLEDVFLFSLLFCFAVFFFARYFHVNFIFTLAFLGVLGFAIRYERISTITDSIRTSEEAHYDVG